MKTLATLWILLFALFLASPLVQMKWPVLREKPLHGVLIEYDTPQFQVSGWFSGAFQKQFDGWFSRKIGFRPSLVRTDNQIGLSLFREVTARTADPVVMGKDHVLYQKSGLDSRNRLDLLTEEHVRSMAQRIKSLQEELAERGVAFLVVIAPSKAEIYPEYIPASRVLEHRLELKTNYESMMSYLHEYDVHVVDSHELLLAAKEDSPYVLFPPGGIHWNLYSAGLVTQAIVDKLAELTGKDLVNIRCESVELRDEPGEAVETDLADLLNVWSMEHADWKFPRPTFTNDATPDKYPLRIAWVGDSLAHYPVTLMYLHKVIKSLDFYSYYSTVVSVPRLKGRRLDKDKLDWEKKIFSKDAVVVEVGEFMIDRIGWGFIEDALAALGAEEVISKQ